MGLQQGSGKCDYDRNNMEKREWRRYSMVKQARIRMYRHHIRECACLCRCGKAEQERRHKYGDKCRRPRKGQTGITDPSRRHGP
ncbi:hypothetical protein L210DRAFT_2811254 [Boletus edulis BED1]|uniref:Uncharacterized protein n=1 Tax=Boletus edulis BED1 TaxID=1328754 RepID=A0AAD4C3R6_BOLED|nr:hypothetical protein L210DRAFT_2811254 [Boletus edulis BED1]